MFTEGEELESEDASNGLMALTGTGWMSSENLEKAWGSKGPMSSNREESMKSLKLSSK